MSLLLLFPSEVTVTTFACWSVVASPSTTWTNARYDYRQLWGDWEGTTWGAIGATGFTWGGMAGQTFSIVNTNSTTWTVVTINSCSSV